MPNYWVCGAMWGGHDDQSDIFIRRGYWLLGHDDAAQPRLAERRDQIQAGDRIAIKRMLGRGAQNIEIRALGIVMEVDEHDTRVYIDWLVKGLEREVPARGCFASIHGPFLEDDEWVHRSFHI